MNIRHKPLKTKVNTAVIGILASSVVHAGGFSLYTEGTGYATGNFAAGIAAEAYDASTGWYNPAGLALIRDQQAVFGGVGVFPTAKLSGTSTFTQVSPVLGTLNYIQTFADLNGAENAFVPSFHYARPLGENATFGFSVTSPFGLSTDWGPDSPVRYQGSFTELITTNISPELGAKVTDNLALGAGLDLQYARVKFNRILGLPTVFNVLGNPYGSDSLTYNKGDSWSVGFHAGIMAMFNDNHTRLGLNYQSEMRHKFRGYSQLTGPLAGSTSVFGVISDGVFRSDDLYSSAIDLPDVVTLSAYHDLNEKVALLASVVYNGWSSFKNIELFNIAAPSIRADGAISRVYASNSSPQNYKDTVRVALGANYHVNEKIMLRVGGGYDPTPTNDIDRDVRLPDTDRWALSIGGHYQATDALGFELGYTHLFPASHPVINRTDALAPGVTYNVSAVGKAGASLVGIQATWTMDKEKPVSTK
ncbi:OmpP1/FadL family transporter [Legionella waltersii]|uniref:Long chain fatty acid transporter n=1 Tax=Legionella waltersii TaxID=66969 RepID=A0A0W1AAQ1_9GAMM|nr:outer membrane protein transport protein [Legionella waltersii]KTD78359.1 long chain fatty acid transporter [Legionella waltersii]SNV06467.1 long chain fatty acid transporter [Legionella waltersii]